MCGRLSSIYFAVIVGLLFSSNGRAENIVKNGGFESGFSPWSWMAGKEVKAAYKLDSSECHSGRWSLRMTNTTPAGPNIYGALRQVLKDLHPNTTYRIGLWCKGKDVGCVWIGGGVGWNLRQRFPTGEYDWTWVTMDFKTAANETSFDMITALEGPTQAVWIDDVEVMEIGESRKTARLYSRPLAGQLNALDQFYPAPEGSNSAAPVLRMRDPSDEKFGMDVQIFWNSDGLGFNLDLLDSTPGPITHEFKMFTSDSVQIGIDTNPAVAKKGYTKDCFELGFALAPTGKVTVYAWQPEKFDWAGVETSGERTEGGYRLHLLIPWHNMNIDPSKFPQRIGVNVLVNDGQGSTVRRFLEWTPGMSNGKLPENFPRVILAKEKEVKAGRINIFGREYDQGEWVRGEYLEYAFSTLPAEELRLAIQEGTAESKPVTGNIMIPPTKQGYVRRILFSLPPELFEREGNYILTTTPAGPVLAATLTRLNARAQIRNLLAPLGRRFTLIETEVKKHPEWSNDAYVKLGLTVIQRFFDRVKTGGPEGKQPLEWSKLQLKELDWVLGRTEDRLAQLTQQPNGLFPTPKIPTGKIHVKDGKLLVGETPFFFGGYGHHGGCLPDLPNFTKFGATSVMQGYGPRDLRPDGSLIYTDVYDSLLPRAAQNGLNIDLLLGPHMFPEWAFKKWPDLWTGYDGFVKYNVDHPEARRIIQHWLELLIPRVKDLPGLLALCLNNEPAYGNSGRDSYSRPKWIKFLQRTHGSIDALNTLYGTHYKIFDNVPVPPYDMPKGVSARRAFYDWIIFNRENFTAWHRWMNEIVKKIAPDVLTHTKIIPDPFLDRAYPNTGIDHEEMCRFSDLAGNDCDAYWTPKGTYAYDWQKEEMWYDLLFSFAGKPVVNSENHLIPDGFPAECVPPQHTRSVLWQGALHRQYVTEIWVWEEATWGSCISLDGSIYLRPANMYAAGQAMLDVNRLAKEITTVNALKPRIALLYSVPSLFWDEKYLKIMEAVYAQLNFLGLPVTFVSEKQLASMQYRKTEWIVVPGATHVLKSSITALHEYDGKLLLVGKDNLMWDEYHRRQNLPKSFDRFTVAKPEEIQTCLKKEGVEFTALEETETREPAWGVEFRCVPDAGRLLVPMNNLMPKAQIVKLNLKGKAVDLIIGRPVKLEWIRLEPMTPILLEVKQ